MKTIIPIWGDFREQKQLQKGKKNLKVKRNGSAERGIDRIVCERSEEK